MMRTIQVIAKAVVLLVAAFLVGRCTAPEYEAETQVVERVDTMLIRDTVIREKPVYRTEYVFVRDSVRVQVHDTLYISLPRQMRVYEDSLYRAEVSGYEPSLDRIEIYAPTRVVTKTEQQVVHVKKPSRWGMGVQVGYGINIYNGIPQCAPYVGVGVSYNLLTF